ncbi:ribonuclease P protein component [Ilumatobacter sp.]|uniref:ribonuclease P protein component n=1 Tax=Ilumatobacter sp. TaxID=1967498 RepID=UPI003B527E3B
MIERIRTRDTFVRLRREGRRVRIEPLWCTYSIEPASDTAEVAFAINRAVGNAVVRNRLRRRLRAILSGLDVPHGSYLVGCRPAAAELTFDQLRGTTQRLVERIAQRQAAVEVGDR